MKLKPLKQWVCDQCGQIINRPQDGWLEWIYESKDEDNGKPNSDLVRAGFRVVHTTIASPLRPTGSCLYPSSYESGDLQLTEFLGPNGLDRLMALLTDGIGVKDLDEFVDLVRRLHMPYYEAARPYLLQAEEAGYINPQGARIFHHTVLKAIAEEFGGEKLEDPDPQWSIYDHHNLLQDEGR